jgi:four helix bundle protein
MQNYQNLEIWKESLNLTVLIYKITETFPKSEIFGITSQIRRASSSIMANITERAARKTNPDFHKFLNIS